MEYDVLKETTGKYLNDQDRGLVKKFLEDLGFSGDDIDYVAITPQTIKVRKIVKENNDFVFLSEKWGKMRGVMTEDFWMDGE